MQETLAARNGPQQIGPDLENPKEIHTFWGGVDFRRKCRNQPESWKTMNFSNFVEFS